MSSTAAERGGETASRERLPELLAPARSAAVVELAAHYGADAVYVGAAGAGLRAAANLELEELRRCVEQAHQAGIRIYVTANIFARNQDLGRLRELCTLLVELEVDAVIVADPGVLRVVRRHAPGLACHLSTQANVTNSEAARFWFDQGIERIILARELTLSEIAEIAAEAPAEVEVFVHGALCVAISGRCLLSNYTKGREANRGACAQPCRWEYALVDRKEGLGPFPIEDDGRHGYILNTRDLCLLPHLQRLRAAGVHAFKIEGRTKASYYVAVTTALYRAGLRRLLTRPNDGELPPEWERELEGLGNRGYTTGFLFGDPEGADMSYELARRPQRARIVGIVREPPSGDWLPLTLMNPLRVGDTVEIIGPELQPAAFRLEALCDANGRPLPRANTNDRVKLAVPLPTRRLDILRRWE
jgi:putative protease